MNDKAEWLYRTICACVILILAALFMLLCYDYGHVVSEVVPEQSIKEKVLSYPYRDNSPTLKAAEAKVVKKMTDVERKWILQQQNSTCAPNGKDCGFLIYSSWIECGP